MYKKAGRFVTGTGSYEGKKFTFVAICFREGRDNKGRECIYREIKYFSTTYEKKAERMFEEIVNKKIYSYLVLIYPCRKRG